MRGATVKILVVEDEPKTGNYLKQGLSEAGFVVDLARDGNDGLHLATTENYDLIVLDIMLPGRDGWSILKSIRDSGDTIPVLFLTARDQVDDRVKGLESGADDYLVKPFAFEELVARLRALQRRAPESRPPQITVADLVVDPAARTVSRAGRPVELTTTEYALLEYLARQAGQVCGRAQISGAVWDENYDPFSNIIDVYVSRIRRKVDQPGLTPLIHTVRGAGYSLDPNRGGRSG